jgi:hypothetical protein
MIVTLGAVAGSRRHSAAGITLTTATLTDSAGVTSLTLVFSGTASGHTGFTVTATPAMTLGTGTGDGTNTLVFPCLRQAIQGETVTLDYTAGNVTGLSNFSAHSVTNSSGFAYLVNEGAEGGVTPVGWTNSGTVAWNYTTAPYLLEGSNSLEIGDNTSFTWISITAASNVWGYCLFASNSGASPVALRFRNGTTGVANLAFQMADGSVKITCGSATAVSSAGLVSAGNVYSVWLHYLPGTGSNAQCEAYVATTPTRPGSPTVSLSNGTSNTVANRFYFFPAGGTAIQATDHMRVSTSPIGSNPP